MANETVLFKRGDSATITSTPITDGQILFDTSGNGKMYLDNGTTRLTMGGAVTIDSTLSKTSTNAIQNKAVTGNILNSLAEVSAATQQNTIAGALALKEVNSSLKANNNQIYMDYHDGKYGINTSSSRGADTFIPFHSNHKIKTQTLTLYPSRIANPSPNPTWIFDKLERVDGVLSVSSVYGYMSSGSKSVSSFSIGFYISGNKVIMSTGLPSEWSYGQGYTCTAFMIED